VLYFNFPALLLAVALSGDAHSPTAYAAWLSFGIYTLLYCAVVMVVYVIVREWYMVRQSRCVIKEFVERLPTTYRRNLNSRTIDSHLDCLGRAITQIEGKRRKCIFLENMDCVDLKSSPKDIATQFLSSGKKHRVSVNLLKYLEKDVAKNSNDEYARKLMEKIKERTK
jgi:hypothetical protein